MSKFIDCNGKEIQLGDKVVGVKSGVSGIVDQLKAWRRQVWRNKAKGWENEDHYQVNVIGEPRWNAGVYKPENLEVQE
jgi:hypothetical protein